MLDSRGLEFVQVRRLSVGADASAPCARAGDGFYLIYRQAVYYSARYVYG